MSLLTCIAHPVSSSRPCRVSEGEELTHTLSADGTAVLNGQAGFVLEAPWINSSTTHHNPRPDGLVNETYHKPGVAHDSAPGTSRQMDQSLAAKLTEPVEEAARSTNYRRRRSQYERFEVRSVVTMRELRSGLSNQSHIHPTIFGSRQMKCDGIRSAQRLLPPHILVGVCQPGPCQPK